MTAFQLPDHFRNRASRGIAQMLRQSLPTGNVPYLSIKGGAFTLVDAAGNERRVGAMDPQLGVYLDICVVDSNPHVSKIYYANAFDPNAEAFTPPTCFSDNGIAPSAQAVQPQHKDCKTCPHNQWGSDTSRMTGKSTKACNDAQKVAIAVPGQGDMVFLLRVPPASLKHLGKYVQEIEAAPLIENRKLDISDFLTRVYFQRDSVGVLGFTFAGLIDAATMAVADKVWETKSADQLVGKNDQPYTGEIGVLPAARQVQGHALPPPLPGGAPLQMRTLPQSPGMPIPGQPFVSPQGDVHAPDGTNLTAATAAKQRRGRPRKEASEAPQTSAPAPTNGGDAEPIPPFLQRIEQAPGMPVNQLRELTPAQLQARNDAVVARSQPSPSFGMQAPAATPDDMQARIAAVLAMKTGNA